MDDNLKEKDLEIQEEKNPINELNEIINNDNLSDKEKIEFLKKNLNFKSLGFNTKKHFGRQYKAKRRKKNKMTRKSRKANR